MSMDDDQNAVPDGDEILVAEYALGLLDADQHRQAASRIAADSALSAELGMWQSRLAGLDSQFAEAPAPAGLFGRIENRLFGAPQRGGVLDFWHSLRFWRSFAGVALAAAIFSVSLNLMQAPRLDPNQFATQLVAALRASEGSGVEFVALYDAASGRVRLTALSGAAVPEKDFELWYIKGDEPAVSMGVIPVDQRTEISLPPDAQAKFGEGIVLAVTLEQKGGSPTGVAQGPIVSVGAAIPI